MPEEQNKILQGKHLGWYQFNYHKLKTVAPDEWLFKVGDQVEILAGKDKGKQGEIVVVSQTAELIGYAAGYIRHIYSLSWSKNTE